MTSSDTPASLHGDLDALTEQVVDSFATSENDRFREIMTSLVRHLHGFAREVHLTIDEWVAGLDFLARTGEISDERRHEFVLLSDILGLSMLEVGMNHSSDPHVTESTVLGPFFTDSSPIFNLGEDIAATSPGSPCWVTGTISSSDGTPLPHVKIDIWGADEDGLYDVQYVEPTVANRGTLYSDEQGGFRFWTVLPTAYPVPVDGPGGELLLAAQRSAMRPAHLHFKLNADGHAELVTHIFVAGDDYLDSDVVFGVKNSLVREFIKHDAEEKSPKGMIDQSWYSANVDFVLGRTA